MISIIGLELTVPPGSIRFVLAEDRPQGRYLSPTGWMPGVSWLIPELVDATANRVNLVVGGDLARYVEPGSGLKFGLSYDGQNLATTARFTWPTAAVARPQGGGQPTSYPPAQPTSYPPAQPTSYPQAQQTAYPPPAPQTSGNLPALSLAPPASPRDNKKMIAVAAAAIAVLAVGVPAWFLTSRTQDEPRKAGAPEDAAPAKSGASSTQDSAALLKGTPAELYARGTGLRSAGKAGDAFLVLREAARNGHAQAALAVGRMYDPVLFGQEPSPFSVANPVKAAEWYKQSKDLGNAEAEVRIAPLVEWLTAKAQANDTAATEALAILQK